jgi:hypothetical protein
MTPHASDAAATKSRCVVDLGRLATTRIAIHAGRTIDYETLVIVLTTLIGLPAPTCQQQKRHT